MLEHPGEILRDPQADEPRRRYAAMLAGKSDEVSRAHAELIAVQLELARAGRYEARYFDLMARAVELLQKHGRAISGAGFLGHEGAPFEAPDFSFGSYFPPYRKLDPDSWTFDRGFLGAASMPVQVFLPNAAEIFARFPLTSLDLSGFWNRGEMKISPALDAETRGLYESVFNTRDEIWGTEVHAPALAQCRELARLRKLELHCHLVSDESVIEILRSPHLENLESLALHLNNQTAAIAQALIEARLPRLRQLKLLWDDQQGSNSSFDDAGAEILARGKFERLESFSIASDGISSSGWATLLRAPFVERLSGLSLLGDEGEISLDAIAGRRFNWRRLTLSLVEEEDDVRSLAGASLPELRELELCHLGGAMPEFASIMAKASWAPQLIHLNIGDVGDAGLSTLSDSACFGGLKSLRFSSRECTDAGARALADSRYIRNLTALDMSSFYSETPITRRGLEAVLNSPATAGLRFLLFSAEGSGEMLEPLTRSSNLSELRALNLYLWKIGPELARQLTESPHLAKVVRFAGWGQEAAEVLGKRWPDYSRMGTKE